MDKAVKSPVSPDPAKPPTANAFRIALLQILCEETGSVPNVPVQLKHLFARVIRKAGWDPDNLAQYGDPALGWRRDDPDNQRGAKGGFDRQVTFALRPLKRNGFVMEGTKNGWSALTEAGVVEAKSYGPVPKKSPGGSSGGGSGPGKKEPEAPKASEKPKAAKKDPAKKAAHVDFAKEISYHEGRISEHQGRVAELRRIQGWKETSEMTPQTMTGLYFGHHLADPRFMGLIRGCIGAHLPVSKRSGLVDDHVDEYICKSIERDSLREDLLSGHDVPGSKIAAYAVRSAFNDIRSMGTNPVTREIYGARTVRERDKGIVLPPARDPARVSLSLNDDGTVELDPHDGGAGATAVLQRLGFEEAWGRVEDLFGRCQRQAGMRYLRVIQMKAKGFTVTEIADAEHVTNARASTLLARAKKRLYKEELKHPLNDIVLKTAAADCLV